MSCLAANTGRPNGTCAPVAAGTDPYDACPTDDVKTCGNAANLRASRARQASRRRRLIDPATCERDYSAAEMEFMKAIQDYKQASGRMFPTWSEVLEVFQGLGYEKTCEARALGQAR